MHTWKPSHNRRERFKSLDHKRILVTTQRMLEEAIKNENFINSFAGMHPASNSRGFQAVLFDSQLIPLSHDWTLEQTQQLSFEEEKESKLMKLKYFATKVKETHFPWMHNSVIFVNRVWMKVLLNAGRKSKFLKASSSLKEFPQRKSTINENITGLNLIKTTVDSKNHLQEVEVNSSKWTASELGTHSNQTVGGWPRKRQQVQIFVIF